MKRMKRIKSRGQNETRIITRAEEAKIITLLRSAEHSEVKSYYHDVADLVEVLADTGMRVGEALDLRNTDINFETGLITVPLSKSKPRRVPMTRRVAVIFKRRLEAASDKPFTLKEHQIHRAWSWVREQIGIADAVRLVLYSLRKSCAQRLFDAGVEPGIIYEWLGYPLIRMEHRLVRLPLHKLLAAAETLENLQPCQ